MDPLKMPEVEPGPPGRTAPEGAVPAQRRPQRQLPTARPWDTVLIAGPDGTANDALRTALSRIGADKIVQADSTRAVRDVLAHGGTGDLALVSARFGTDTDPLIRALLGGGWSRVIVRTPTGATKPVVSAVLAGATGVLTIPGATHDPGTDPRVPTTLTAREIEVVTQVAGGRSNKEIATVMSLSALTVKNHLARIGRKLGTGDRAQIVAMACRDGVIS
jgi:DNA-binding NarL/FixJ family response regulator